MDSIPMEELRIKTQTSCLSAGLFLVFFFWLLPLAVRSCAVPGFNGRFWLISEWEKPCSVKRSLNQGGNWVYINCFQACCFGFWVVTKKVEERVTNIHGLLKWLRPLCLELNSGHCWEVDVLVGRQCPFWEFGRVPLPSSGCGNYTCLSPYA